MAGRAMVSAASVDAAPINIPRRVNRKRAGMFASQKIAWRNRAAARQQPYDRDAERQCVAVATRPACHSPVVDSSYLEGAGDSLRAACGRTRSHAGAVMISRHTVKAFDIDLQILTDLGRSM